LWALKNPSPSGRGGALKVEQGREWTIQTTNTCKLFSRQVFDSDSWC
jgi:hypothetical protein